MITLFSRGSCDELIETAVGAPSRVTGLYLTTNLCRNHFLLALDPVLSMIGF
jgi:hypothetical protein